MTTERAGYDVKKTHTQCIMCGDNNPMSLRLKFKSGVKGGVSASFQGNSLLQGYDGILHGGVISAMLDSAMANCLFYRDIEAVTGELLVRFMAPVPFDASLIVRAWLVNATPPLYQLKAELEHAGIVMASADAKFMQRLHANASSQQCGMID